MLPISRVSVSIHVSNIFTKFMELFTSWITIFVCGSGHLIGHWYHVMVLCWKLIKNVLTCGFLL